MNNLREAALEALEALQVAATPLAKDRQEVLRAQAALRAALEQPAGLNLHCKSVQARLAEQCGYVSKHLADGDTALLQQCLEVLALFATDESPEGYEAISAYLALEARLKLAPFTKQPAAWQGLTDEEIHNTEGYREDRELYRFTRAIEAKLKEKNK